MVNFVYWNVRGACNTRLNNQIKSVCRGKLPDLLILAETKCDRIDNLRCLEKLGYDRLDFVPSFGRSGGLVVSWKSMAVDVSLIGKDRQYMHLRCSLVGRPTFLLSAIYALPSPTFKQSLWQELQNFAGGTSLPWVVVGDFNDILASHERTGGVDVNFSRIKLFQDRIQACQLSDMGSCGPSFTWRGPKLPNYHRLFERLDRVLANNIFLSAFANSYVQVLTRTKFSDHNPIVLYLENVLTPVPPTFRFEAMWLGHAQFNSFLEEN